MHGVCALESSSVYLLFLPVCVHFIATESEECGLVHSPWNEAMCRHGQMSSCSLAEPSYHAPQPSTL